MYRNGRYRNQLPLLVLREYSKNKNLIQGSYSDLIWVGHSYKPICDDIRPLSSQSGTGKEEADLPHKGRPLGSCLDVSKVYEEATEVADSEKPPGRRTEYD